MTDSNINAPNASNPLSGKVLERNNSEPNSLLKAAWSRHDTYSTNASSCQKRFVNLRTILVVLSVVVIVLSVARGADVTWLKQDSWITKSFDKLLLILPIVITALLAFSVKFDRGNNWLLLRGSAESLKMEIYRYRAKVGEYKKNWDYKQNREYKQSREAVLAQKIKIISERLKGSAVHQAALKPFEDTFDPNFKPDKYRFGLIIKLLNWLTLSIQKLSSFLWNQFFGITKEPSANKREPDLYSDLDAESYLECRLNDQFTWYRKKAQSLDRRLQQLEIGIYVFGGVGTFLAATDRYKSWVAVATAMTGACSNYLDFKRIEATLVGYNRAADALYDVRAWWIGLSSDQQKEHKNFELLVTSAEEIIRSEHVSWLQDMQDRLAELYGHSESDQETHSAQHPDTHDGYGPDASDEGKPEAREKSMPDKPEAAKAEATKAEAGEPSVGEPQTIDSSAHKDSAVKANVEQSE